MMEKLRPKDWFKKLAAKYVQAKQTEQSTACKFAVIWAKYHKYI
jgi:hypothetical protein